MSTPTDRDGTIGEPSAEGIAGEQLNGQTEAEAEYTDLPAAVREHEQEEEFPPEFGGGSKDFLGYSDSLDVAGNHP